LKPGWIDVFVGEARMVSHARRLGVQYWTVRVCSAPAARIAADAPETRAGPARVVASAK
jgi:hypothetical protein